MHKHQMDVLIAELKRPEYAGLSADAAYNLLSGRQPQTGAPGRFIDTRSEAEKRLGKVHFLTTSQSAARMPKHISPHAVIVPDELASEFPTGIPGMPNTVRRPEFDEAWSQR